MQVSRSSFRGAGVSRTSTPEAGKTSVRRRLRDMPKAGSVHNDVRHDDDSPDYAKGMAGLVIPASEEELRIAPRRNIADMKQEALLVASVSNPDSSSDEFKPSASRGSGRRASASQTQTHPKPNGQVACLECFVYEACIFSIFSQKPVKPPLASA
ncbi:predicted protein [Histoplasma capsulatum H143]|uniref:Uncharacterized protein n=1 Tax=Ajellomyces capsulatus (strain H143) TaxID=544712 RepID=C6HE93_AJECH|nr:predicted protein [Histoplasma capsulatum H143]